MTRFVPLIAYMGVIFTFSSISGPALAPYAPDDRISHFAEYFLFGWAAMLAMAGYVPRVGWKQFASGWALGFVYAIGDEFHQSFVPGRDSSAGDVLFDVAGLTASVCLIALLTGREDRS